MKILLTIFSEELILLIINKGLIGLLIIIAGYILNKAIEKYKSKKEIENAITRRKIEKLNQICDALADYENCVNDIHICRALIVQTELEFIKSHFDTEEELNNWIQENSDEFIDTNMLSKPIRDKMNSMIQIHKDKLDKLEKEEEEKGYFFFDTLNKNRFWISKKQHERFNKFMRKLTSNLEQKFESLKDFEDYINYQKMIEKNRFNIDTLLINK